MVPERELIGLLYRADWTELTLSGTVTGTEPVVHTVMTAHSGQPVSGPWQRKDGDQPPWRWEDDGPPPRWLFEHVAPPWMFEQAQEAWEARHGRPADSSWSSAPGGEDAECSISVAPGQRFRADGGDGTWALGCDGTRMWHWLRDARLDISIQFGFSSSDRPQPPYRTLFVPSWLLTAYSLTLEGEVTVAGRAGVRVRGTVRTVAERPEWVGGRPGRSAGAGGLLAPIPRWLSNVAAWDREVEAVVDAELGILLRCSRWSGDATPQVTEFSSLDVPGTAAAAAFSAPPGSVFGSGKGGSWPRGPHSTAAGKATGASFGDAVGEALGTAGKEAAKAVAGIAAGGLGALIKYAPSRQRVDPFAQAAAEAADPDAVIPADETAPDGPAAAARETAALPDEVLDVIYRSGLVAPPFGATLHQWFDAGALLAAVPQSVRGNGFGGVGFLVDALRDTAQESTAGASHAISNVRMRAWREYRIDVMQSAADAAFFRSRRRNREQAQTIASDGERQWRVFADRVVAAFATPPPSELADLVDASWLLDDVLDLSGGTETWLGGRRAYRIEARYREDAWTGFDWWKRLFFPAVAVVDTETGLVLRLTRFKDGRPALRQELRDVTALDASTGFGFTPPAGLRVEDIAAMQAEDRPGFSWTTDPPR